MSTIKSLKAREIIDSRAIPTIECTLYLDSGHQVTTSVPTGASVGKYEALELRDGDMQHMAGKGVLKAVNNLNTIISPALIGQDSTQQTEIDQLLINLDGTANKSNLGANTILAASQAVLKAGALSMGLELYQYIYEKYKIANQPKMPVCIYSLINGGEHGADNLDLQDFQIIPASHLDFPSSLNMSLTIFHKLEEVLVSKGAVHGVGLVGGFTPTLYTNTDAFEILIETIKATPYTFAQDLFFGIDAEAANFFEGGKYRLKDKSQPYSPKELLEYYVALRNSKHVFYIEDPFEEDDWKSWQTLTSEIGETTRIAGDNLLSTNKEKLAKAIKEKACNTALIKPNQVGTISESIEVAKMAREAGLQVVVSHRSGETNDSLMADLAVGIGADYAKFGAPDRGERVAKYNRMLEISKQLGEASATASANASASESAAASAAAPVAAATGAPAQQQQPQAPTSPQVNPNSTK